MFNNAQILSFSENFVSLIMKLGENTLYFAHKNTLNMLDFNWICSYTWIGTNIWTVQGYLWRDRIISLNCRSWKQFSKDNSLLFLIIFYLRFYFNTGAFSHNYLVRLLFSVLLKEKKRSAIKTYFHEFAGLKTLHIK